MNTPDDIFWLRQLRDLERYCNEKGYRVVYRDVETDAVYFEKKMFVMNSKLSNEVSMYHLLHEIGHLRVMRKKKTYNEVYDYIFDNFSKASLTHKIAILQEELDAWREGLNLARRLDIHIDRRKWEITKTKCISTYLSWAVRNKGYNTKGKRLNEESNYKNSKEEKEEQSSS